MGNSSNSKFAIEIFQKRDKTIRISIITDVGDITNAKLWLFVKTKTSDLDEEAVITKKSLNNGGADTDAIVVDGPNRIIDFFIVETDTESLEPMKYNYDAVIELPGGDKVQLIPPSEFKIKQPVTLT